MSDQKVFVSNALEATIRIGILVLLATWCFTIVRPFIIPIVWGIIIAVSEYTGYLKLRRFLGGRGRTAAALIALLGLVLLIAPTVMLSGTLVDSAQGLAEGLQQGSISVPPPPEELKRWPMVGDELYGLWLQASQNLAAVLTKIAPQLKVFGTWMLSSAVGAGFGILQFVIAIIIAGLLLANSEAGGRAAYAFATRLSGEKGADFATLAEATVRSVTRGILGVALIQSLLAGVGFMVMGIPGAGLWALLCLMLSVVQIGIFPITVPVVIYVFSTADTVPAVVFLVWALIVGLLDNILKPILLGRGVEVPMAVIFVGAIGGFLSSGIIGLFVGAVVLVLGYRLFLAWLGNTSPGPVLASGLDGTLDKEG
ncbi:MAG: AI-2E family transporter [Gammaproteobacteria bacterium]|nr:AI-2E family transporter [Gammaproteobacteria bacterium]